MTSDSNDVFRGAWTSIDNDGSHQTLDIRGSGRAGHHGMFLFDDSATTACEGSPAHFQGSGVGRWGQPGHAGTLTCMPGGNPLGGRVSIAFVDDPRTDTLSDDSGVTWYRA